MFGMNSNVIAGNLKRLMKEKQISQSELARRSGLYQPDISRIANGHIDAKVSKLAEAFGVELEEFTKPLPQTVDMSFDDLVQSLTPEQRSAFMMALGKK